MKNILKTALVLAAFAGVVGTAQASAFFDCEGEGVVVSSHAAPETKPDEAVAWMVEVDVRSARYTGGHIPEGTCAAAIKKVTVTSQTERQAGETVEILYRSYSGMTPNGPMSSETWSIKPQPHQP